MLIDIKLNKKSVAELGHNGRLKIYVDLKNLCQPTHLSPIPQNGRVYLAEILYEVPSQQKIWDQQGPHMEFYMGPIWAPHMGLGWDLQHSSMWYPHGQTHMGHNMGTIWVLFWIWPKRPMSSQPL